MNLNNSINCEITVTRVINIKKLKNKVEPQY